MVRRSAWDTHSNRIHTSRHSCSCRFFVFPLIEPISLWCYLLSIIPKLMKQVGNVPRGESNLPFHMTRLKSEAQKVKIKFRCKL